MTNPTCFVIQRFDGGLYDKRYTEVIEPALKKADIEPLRADKILGTRPIIEKIEQAIQTASICLVEISTENENVWLELGYALALQKPCIIICETSKRDKIPFDVAHRPVIFYDTNVPSDFKKLESQITENALTTAAQSAMQKIQNKKTDIPQDLDLKPNETDILIEMIAEGLDSPEYDISAWGLLQKMEAKGYTKAAVGAGLQQLDRKAFIEKTVIQSDFNQDPFYGYNLTTKGKDWLIAKSETLNLNTPKLKPERAPKSQKIIGPVDLDEEIPF